MVSDIKSPIRVVRLGLTMQRIGDEACRDQVVACYHLSDINCMLKRYRVQVMNFKH